MSTVKITDIKELPLHKEIESGEWAEKWIQIGLTEGPRVSDEDVRKLCEFLELECKVICWAPVGPRVAGRACRLVLGGHSLDHFNGKDIPEEYVEKHKDECADVDLLSEGYVRFGQHDASWCGYHLAYEGAIDVSETKLYEPIVKGASWWFHAKDTVILCPRVAPKLDENNELHCEDGPALWDFVYALHGIVLDEEHEWIVKERDTLSREKIDGIQNAEIRRVVIDTWPDKYITWDPIQKDEFGELYELPDTHEEGNQIRYVKVNDTYRANRYWLRVPPTVTTAHEAVASTFGMTADEYKPSVET